MLDPYDPGVTVAQLEDDREQTEAEEAAACLREYMEYQLRAHYDAAYLAALSGLSGTQSRNSMLFKFCDVDEAAVGIAIASLRNRAAALAERDAVIKEVINAL